MCVRVERNESRASRARRGGGAAGLALSGRDRQDQSPERLGEQLGLRRRAGMDERRQPSQDQIRGVMGGDWCELLR